MERPRSLLVAAGLLAIQGVALLAWGVGELLRALVGAPHDKGTAVLLGVVVVIYAAGVLTAASGLWLARRWAQTPAYMVSFFAIVVGLGQVHTLPALMVPLIVVGIATVVSVSTAASRAALDGI
jgi:hypothetical protein